MAIYTFYCIIVDCVDAAKFKMVEITKYYINNESILKLNPEN